MNIVFLIFFGFFVLNSEVELDVKSDLEYCSIQIGGTLDEIQGKNKMPRYIPSDSNFWLLEDVDSLDPWWTIGFWPGILWYNFENTQHKDDLNNAMYYTALLDFITDLPAKSHDLGFLFQCSYGNGYRLTGETSETYKNILIKTAESLSALFSPIVGTIWSWPYRTEWPYNTIIDNMMNLELLFQAAKLTSDKEQSQKFYNIAVTHAETTMKNHFRSDYSSYHVVVYDDVDGHFIKGVTAQGYSDDSQWTRGQAWAVYGFTMVYRETKDKKFLRFTEKITDYYLKRLHEHDSEHGGTENGWVPYWDFDDPRDLNQTAPRDTSAAAVVASALLELTQLEDDPAKRNEYFNAAMSMLDDLAGSVYRTGTGTETGKHSFLLHSTGSVPGGTEIDVSLIYADYYYIEALTRYRKMLE